MKHLALQLWIDRAGVRQSDWAEMILDELDRYRIPPDLLARLTADACPSSPSEAEIEQPGAASHRSARFHAPRNGCGARLALAAMLGADALPISSLICPQGRDERSPLTDKGNAMFLLGKRLSPDPLGSVLLTWPDKSVYSARDLMRSICIFGMTGSGKSSSSGYQLRKAILGHGRDRRRSFFFSKA